MHTSVRITPNKNAGYRKRIARPLGAVYIGVKLL